MRTTAVIGLLFTLLLLHSGCRFEPDEWSVEIPAVGSSSSPVATDLNGDGHLDVVLGGAGPEFTQLDAAILALDGLTGEVLWQVEGHNQMVGTAILKDITGDGTEDVFIGGRSAMFKAIDGRSGELIWEHLPFDERLDYLNDTTLLNFYTGQWIPDANGDGAEDILTGYGGFVKARRGDPDRPAGYLMVLDGKTGRTIVKAAVPDGKETYLSPLAHDFGNGPEVIFGTGGEDISGNLYRVPLDALLAGSIKSATVVVAGGQKGMIAPPLLTDVTADGVADIVIATVDGRLVATDGKSNERLWSAGPEGDFDTYVMPAPGYFTGDDKVPDFFASFGKGAWPNTDYTVHLLVDGKDGTIVSLDTLGSFQYASPLVVDLDEDGANDVMICVNEIMEVGNQVHKTKLRSNNLYAFLGGKGPGIRLFEMEVGTNLGSTPLLCDMDGDDKLDIVTVSMGDPLTFYSFKLLNVTRREMNIAASGISFGGYMGAERTGYFE